jgi:uncharacterized protein involved in tolerance to divalent cations
VSEVTKTIKEMHSDKIPEVIAIDVVDGNADYIDWVLKNTKAKK